MYLYMECSQKSLVKNIEKTLCNPAFANVLDFGTFFVIEYLLTFYGTSVPRFSHNTWSWKPGF